MQGPEREAVYAAWIKVQQLEKELARARAEHQRLANARYKDNAEQLRQDKLALNISD